MSFSHPFIVTCDICGREHFDSDNEIPHRWIAVIGGGEYSELSSETYTTYADNREIGSYVVNQTASGPLKRLVCDECLSKLSFEEDDK